MSDKEADICLILEGTYPYVKGGVSSWAHELIKSQSHLKFHITALLAPGKTHPKMRYQLPDNVTGIDNVVLQKLPKTKASIPKAQLEKLFMNLEIPLLNIQAAPSLKEIKRIEDLLEPFKDCLSEQILLNSRQAWRMLVRMYNSTMGNSCFLDFFWTWRALMGGLYSVLCADLPKAKVYHALCTGYAGLFLARAYSKTGRPCIVTEHGIYTNERRIEIASADWLDDQRSMDFSVQENLITKDLRDFWIDSFIGYSKICYECCHKIITIYEGNKKFQIADGANEDKIVIIPNGINYQEFSSIKKEKEKRTTIALIGRVVPIKDVKTYIQACSILKEDIPDLHAYVIGPNDEDKDYYQQCIEVVNHNKLKEVITFTGLVNLSDYLGKVDLLVLTSISEAQPLVILEAGAAGIPCVVTDVGACREMIFGKSDEFPMLGPGGDVCPLTDPRSIASSIKKLLTDDQYYRKCSMAAKNRVRKYYNKEDLSKQYYKIYDDLISNQ